MNGNGSRHIEIFAPFGEALERTKLILFQPFDIGKWFVIGFAAFLSHLAGGGGGSFRWQKNWNTGNWNFRTSSQQFYQNNAPTDFTGCVIVGIAVAAVFIIALIVLMLWLGSRGKFIFTDCVVQNRGAIIAPWHEFRREGNSLFLFHLVLGCALLLVVGIGSVPLWLPLLLHGNFQPGPASIIALVLLGCVFVVAMVLIAVISSFMVPIMYRRRCLAMEAFSAAIGMISAQPGAVILYVLFLAVLWIAFSMLSCLTACLTCCITAIPYLGTVVLLPFYVFFLSYLLYFVRQFGPDFDAFASAPIAITAAPVPPNPEPPVQP